MFTLNPFLVCSLFFVHCIMTVISNRGFTNPRTNILKHRDNKAGRRLGRPPPPFSVALKDAVLSPDYPVLSAVSIPNQCCSPKTQRLIKAARFSNRMRSCRHRRSISFRFTKWWLSLLTLTCVSPEVYCMPGTGYVFVQGEASADKTKRQLRMDQVINKLTKLLPTHGPVHKPLSLQPDPALK